MTVDALPLHWCRLCTDPSPDDIPLCHLCRQVFTEPLPAPEVTSPRHTR